MSTEAFQLYEKVAVECSRLGMRSDILGDLEALYKLTEDNRVLREVLAEAGCCIAALLISTTWELAPAVREILVETEGRAREALAKTRGEE